MKVIFRVDASKWIGTGHVMRCLVLADELKKKQVEIMFACLPQQGDLIDLINQKGYSLLKLSAVTKPITPRFDGDYAYWLQRSVQEDAIDFLSNVQNADWVIVDHYALDYPWEKMIKDKLSCKILSIDDLNRNHHSDIILDQNIWPNISTRYKTFSKKKLLGPTYALLRENFAKLHREPIKQKNQVIAFFGGSDPTNECKKLFNAALKLQKFPFTLKIITGRQSENYKLINKLNTSPNIEIFQYLDNFDEELASSRYAIGASGTSNWERFCLRIPSTIVAVAENQKELSSFLAEKKLVKSLGLGTQTTEQVYCKELKRLSKIWEQIKPFDLLDVDGLGSSRIIEEMESFI
ncbi:UDP-2,4-diacetamido-2,4,6-trideoxy-beta-L-altropyranose hydrolase [Providencia stuartii]|uniref:UDP-2,4-diacetamido-2,4, 6-trideoxy-beta-L-altropyranose hydrolase n=1 Tax=Providencia stuartii TaxID=588 RepID=UPI0034E4F8FD